MHDQWYFGSESIPEGLYLIEALQSGKFITCAPERSTLVQQEQNLDNDSESQVFEIQHVGYRDFVIRHHRTGLVLTVHNGSPSPCAPIVLCRYMGARTPYQTVNFERTNSPSNDMLIFVKHTRMVIDIDGGSQNSNARLLQVPHKKHIVDQTMQRFRLHPIGAQLAQQLSPTVPAEFFR